MHKAPINPRFASPSGRTINKAIIEVNRPNCNKDNLNHLPYNETTEPVAAPTKAPVQLLTRHCITPDV